jgi:esterase/lipase
MLFNKVNKNEKDIAVIQAQMDSFTLSHDREMKEMKETIKAIFNKLDSIEQTLRNK